MHLSNPLAKLGLARDVDELVLELAGGRRIYGRTRSAQRAILKAHSQPEMRAGTDLYVNGSHVTNGNSADASYELKNLSRVSSLKTQT
jgi:hypothetical protein